MTVRLGRHRPLRSSFPLPFPLVAIGGRPVGAGGSPAPHPRPRFHRRARRPALQGFALGRLASPLRPGSWPLLLASAVLAWRRSPHSRAVVAASLVAGPVLWLGGDYLGSGDPFRGGQLAKTTQEAVR